VSEEGEQNERAALRLACELCETRNQSPITTEKRKNHHRRHTRENRLQLWPPGHVHVLRSNVGVRVMSHRSLIFISSIRTGTGTVPGDVHVHLYRYNGKHQTSYW
jgi:hypothetical protein